MSKISYEKLAVIGLKDVLEQVNKSCEKLKIDFFIVGAVARNIWYVFHGENARGTQDIDFAVYVPTEKKYNQLREVLLNDYGYQVSTENAFCLITPDGKPVDLLPFGEIEKEGQVLIDGKGWTKINLDGFKESYKMGLNQAIIDQTTYSVCSIPAIMILKLIAYDDRPEHRVKDVKDINAICNYYPELESNSIWATHFDLYNDEREHKDVGLIALGREMKKIINGNQDLLNRILSIIDKAIRKDSNFLSHMIENFEEETLEIKAKILEHIKRGISD